METRARSKSRGKSRSNSRGPVQSASHHSHHSTKSSSEKPEMKDMIRDAIVSLKDRKGSTLMAIRDFVVKKYEVNEAGAQVQVGGALRRGEDAGQFKKTRTGLYRLATSKDRVVAEKKRKTEAAKINTVARMGCPPLA